MEPLEVSLTDIVLRFDNDTLEAFYTKWEWSLRVPIAWLAVRLEPQKRGFIFLWIGAGNPPGPVIYGQDVKTHGRRLLPLPATDEPAARAFFAEVASRTGRTIQS